ncbi:MAG: WD40 repeat domain-containing protein [Anaerolineae bacterium]|nr:WD40 repeat domain-containing protein [Anaerolineae bacterium]
MLECPLCGFSLSHEALAHLEDRLTLFDKRRLFLRWLQEQQYTRAGFVQRFGFKMEDAFLEPLTELDYDDSNIVDPLVELAIARGKRHWAKALAFCGPWGASGGRDRTIRLWQAGAEADFTILSGHQAAIQALAFDEQGDWLASGGDDHTVRLWQTATGQPAGILARHQAEVLCVAFSHSGQWLYSAGQDQTIRVWDLKKRQQRQVLRGHLGAVTCLAPTERQVVSGSVDGSVRLWNQEQPNLPQVLFRLEAPILAVNFDGSTAAAVDALGNVEIWNSELAPLRYALLDSTGPLRSAGFEAGGRRMACVSDAVHLVETISGYLLATLEPARPVEKAIFRQEELWIVYRDGTLEVWEITENDAG